MRVKQLSIFMENKSGRIAEITRVLACAGIDIRALSIADTTDFGILRLIVNQPEKAEQVCKKAGLMTALTDVLAIRIEDRPGSFSDAMQYLACAGVSIEYMYAFSEGETANVVITTNDMDKCVSVLGTCSCTLIKEV